MITRGLVVIALAACGAAPATGKPAPTRAATPAPTRTPAKKNQAVILGTDAKDGATVVAVPAAAGTVTVDAMWFANGKPPTGGYTPAKLATGPNPEHTPQIGIIEQMSGGAGPQWRASAWIAALVAATTLNKDLTDYTFSVSSPGYIDGPSASGLMAAGFLAALTGATIDPSATMTGTINPDGTIGPVGGIPEKFAAAIDKGKKHLGYPIGMRFARSESTGKLVDVVRLAAQRGVDAVEVGSVRQAYHLLTGKQLPEVVPVDEDDMQLDEATNDSLAQQTEGFRRGLMQYWPTVEQLDDKSHAPAEAKQHAAAARRAADDAQKLYEQGFAASAQLAMADAWSEAIAAAAIMSVVTKAQAGDIDAATAVLDRTAQLGGSDLDMFKTIAAVPATTIGAQLRVVQAYRAALRGWVNVAYVQSQRARTAGFLHGVGELDAATRASPDEAGRIATAVAGPIEMSALRAKHYALAGSWLALGDSHAATLTPPPANILRLATSFQSASAAAFQYCDTLLLTDVAKRLKISETAAREGLAQREPQFLFAMIAGRIRDGVSLPPLGELKTAWGDGSPAWLLLTLASEQQGYYDSTELIAKYYSLAIHGDHVDHQKAFIHMLNNAERMARESARAARTATGAIPMQAKLLYQLATVDREGATADKLRALSAYWASSAYSQLAVTLARR